MTDKTYNGWVNFETWATNLEIVEQETLKYSHHGRSFPSVDCLAAELRVHTDDLLDDIEERDGMMLVPPEVYDILRIATDRYLFRVDWMAIARFQAEQYPTLVQEEDINE